MKGHAILVCTALVLGAASVRADVTTDPAMMANAIRQTGNECDEVKSMKKSENPNEARVYHVVCDEGTKYKVVWQEDDTVVVENE
jgi:hypothetical protein